MIRRVPQLMLVAATVLAAGCRTPEPQQPPPPQLHTVYEDAARGSEEIAGRYGLTRFDVSGMPAAAAMVGGCRVYLAEGNLDLVADGRYRLALATERVCARDHTEREEIVKEGLYSVLGFSLFFGDRMVLTSDEPAPEVTTGPEDLLHEIFPRGRFSASGTFRSGRVTATMDDLRTFAFTRQEAGRPPGAVR